MSSFRREHFDYSKLGHVVVEMRPVNVRAGPVNGSERAVSPLASPFLALLLSSVVSAVAQQ